MPNNPVPLVVFGTGPNHIAYHRNHQCTHLTWDTHPDDMGRAREDQARTLGLHPCGTCTPTTT